MRKEVFVVSEGKTVVNSQLRTNVIGAHLVYAVRENFANNSRLKLLIL